MIVLHKLPQPDRRWLFLGGVHGGRGALGMMAPDCYEVSAQAQGFLGGRGLDAVKSLILGGVTRAVVRHADRPGVAIASRAVATRTGQAVEHAQLIGGAA